MCVYVAYKDQCAYSLSCVQLFATPWIVAHQVSLSMVLHRLEWVVIPFSSDLSDPGIKSGSPTLQADSLQSEPPRKPRNTGMGSISLLQGNFPNWESNQGLLHCRWILYQLSYQGRFLLRFTVIIYERYLEIYLFLKCATKQQSQTQW